MRRTIVKRWMGLQRLEPAEVTELPRPDWRGGAQWVAESADRLHVGYGDTIEEACDALATEPMIRVVEEEPEDVAQKRQDELWDVFDAAA